MFTLVRESSFHIHVFPISGATSSFGVRVVSMISNEMFFVASSTPSPMFSFHISDPPMENLF